MYSAIKCIRVLFSLSKLRIKATLHVVIVCKNYRLL